MAMLFSSVTHLASLHEFKPKELFLLVLDLRLIVFCARCNENRHLTGFLRECGYSAVGLMGRLRQSERRLVLADFVEGRANVLVATDVASR